MTSAAGAKARGRSHRRPRGGHDEEHENSERWLLSYVDMVTVLMCLFIVLFAISQVDQTKYVALRESLSAGFHDNASSSVLDGSTGTLDGQSIVPATAVAAGTAGMVNADAGLGIEGSQPAPATAPSPQPTDPNAVSPALLAAAQAEAAHLEGLRDQLAALLTANGLQGAVRFSITDRGLVMGLVADDVFFGPASAKLTPTAERVLDVAGPTLDAIGEQISIEGHANTIPVSGRYATNWELSADRATQVLRRLVESDGLPPTRIMSVGFGDSRPLAEGDSADAMVANRRVDLVVLSGAPEQVRNLLTAVMATEG
ncbi:MAG: OmpA/MotB family protein [Cellulomonas sp.]